MSKYVYSGISTGMKREHRRILQSSTYILQNYTPFVKYLTPVETFGLIC